MAWSVCTATPFCKSPGPLETSRRSPSCDIHVFLALFFLLVSEKVEEKLQQLFGVGFFFLGGRDCSDSSWTTLPWVPHLRNIEKK